MKTLLAVAVIATLTATTAIADTYVRGYTRSDGTYVAPHYRSEPNGNRYDNFSSQGNTNPYTGKRGSQRNEYSDQPVYNKNYGNPGYGNSFGDSQSERRPRNSGW